MRRFALPILVIAAVLAVASPVSAAPTPPGDTVTWGVAPANDQLGKDRTHYNYTLAPGTRITDALAVVNRGAAPITLKVYASDAFTTSSGAIDLLPANRKPVDVGSWITVKNPTITLKPQQSMVVPFTLTVPANATPGDHSGGVVTSLVTSSGAGSVALDRRLGSRIYLRVPGTAQPLLKVDGVHVSYDGTVNPGGSGTTTVTYTVANTGNVRLRAHPSVHVAGPFGLLGRTVALADLPELLPGSSLTGTAVVHGVWPTTRLTAQVRLQPFAGAEDPAVTVRRVTASAGTWGWPLGQLLVVLVLAAGGVGGWWLRRQRKAKVAAAIDAAVANALRGEASAAGGSGEDGTGQR